MDFLDDPAAPEPEPEPTPRPRRHPRRRSTGISDEFWNTLSVLLLVGVVLLFAATFIIFQNPFTPINPYPPDTPIPALIIPTRTITPTQVIRLPGTWTPTPSLVPTASVTPLPPTATDTPDPTITGTPAPVTPTPKGYIYKYQPRSEPNYLSGGVIHPDDGCKIWVAGQALDMKGSPVIGITVEMGGVLNGNNVYLLSLTGTALQYGPGGYEFVLSDKAIKSNKTVWVQLLDQEQVPLSDRITFPTYDTCDKNLILVNFKQVR